MAEKSGFFDAHLVGGEYDRVYLADSFAKYFASFIANGIFGGKSNELMVQQKPTADMSIRVLSGQAWINGYWYENDDELSLAIDVADGVLNRIDSIVVRWNNIERVIRIAIKKGTPASSPSAPVIQRDADYFELKIAEVFVKAGAVRINQADITDTRLNEDVCGLVVGVVQQLDTEEFGKQLGLFVEQFIEDYESWFSQFKTDSNSSVNTLLSESQAKVDKLVSDGQEDIDGVVTTGQQNIAKVVSDGTANINSVVTTGQQNIAKVVSDGTTNINSVVTTGQQNIAKVVTDGQASIAGVVTTGTRDIDNLITQKEAAINTLISTKTSEMNNVILDGQQRFDDIIDELESIAADNDLSGLTSDVRYLEQQSIEDEDYPGCYYRMRNGEREWLNPPMELGVEYRTTERYRGEIVYTKLIYAASLPNNSTMSIDTGVQAFYIISIEGRVLDTDENIFHPIPYSLPNQTIPTCVISSIEYDGELLIYSALDTSHCEGFFTIKYRKP